MNEPVKTLQMQTYDILKNMIISGIYPPGYHMQEAALAKDLGVSRSPVREALKMLSCEGFLDNLPNRGIFVRTFRAKDVEDLFQARAMLESFALKNLPLPLSVERLVYLRTLKRQFEELGDNKEQYVKLDSYLRSALINFSGNSFVTNMYETVNDLTLMFRLKELHEMNTDDEFQQYIRYEIDKINLLLAGDIDRAVAVNTEHLNVTCAAIISKYYLTDDFPSVP